MPYLIGTVLALLAMGMATLVGLDRDRACYPVVMIVIAAYYSLFALMGGSASALWLDAGVGILFAGAAIIGFRTSLWIVAAALAAHGAMDMVHDDLIANAGVPRWWPGFCAAFDFVAAAWLAVLLRLGWPARHRP